MRSINHLRPGLFAFYLTFLLLGNAWQALSFAPKRDFYQLKIYHLKSKGQEDSLDTFLHRAYLPALHRAGISKIGVFKPVEKTDNEPAPTEQLVYVLIPFSSPEQFFQLEQTLEKDKRYLSDGQDYLNAPYDHRPYANFESILMPAFTGMPTFNLPALKSGPAERIYELRSYEAATEKLHQNKVAQFNNGEIGIFKRLGFNTVFCGQVIAGSHLPSLMYLSTFENMAAQKEHWKAFVDDPEWKKLNSMPEYAHNFLRADIYLLHPTAYSEI